MFLHNNKQVFKEVIVATSEYLGKSIDIVEKDYYVTMILKILSEHYDNVVFKGGTSLSKALHVLTRFSEDIDITFSEHIGASRRKKLKNVVIANISRVLGLPITNWDKLQSDRDVNAYVFDYESIVPSNDKLSTGVKLETSLGSYAFPTIEKEIDSYVFQYLKSIDVKSLIEEYELKPFKMHIQTVDRTFIDKIFAICDYYIEGRNVRLSRHLYDIYKLYPLISFDDSFHFLFEEVRLHRANMEVCPSAKPNVDIKELIKKICESDYYKTDYESVTSYFISDSVSYNDVKRCLMTIQETLFLYI